MKAIKKMGSLGDLIGMIPGLKKLAGAADSDQAKLELKRIQAIIDSMTIQERENHLILNGKRRIRIAAGSGTSVQEINRFLKQFDQTRKMMKKLTKLGAGKSMMRGMGFGRLRIGDTMALVIRLRRHGGERNPSTGSWWRIRARRATAGLSIRSALTTRRLIRRSVAIKKDHVDRWLKVGAKPSDTVRKLIKQVSNAATSA